MRKPRPGEWPTLQDALAASALAEQGTQSGEHIRPLHWYVACRLCLEGGFNPDQISPRPPFTVVKRKKEKKLVISFDPQAGEAREETILGGLKTKNVDVVVTVSGIGPVVAVSLKGTLNAVRNLTNRMEEAVGDCTNLHLSYPSLVYAFWHVIRANRPGQLPLNAPAALRTRTKKDKTPPDECRSNDIAIRGEKPVATLERYHYALLGLADRSGTRNHITKYEAVALTLIDADDAGLGSVIDTFPKPDSPLLYQDLFQKIYREYYLRFVYQAPLLKGRTGRPGWAEDSPALENWRHPEYQPYPGDPEEDEVDEDEK
jgi:hypothetical protein